MAREEHSIGNAVHVTTTSHNIIHTIMSKRSNQEECSRQCKFYQSRFPDVPTMSSKELRERQMNDDATTLVLVDVRTRPEREVSMIPGAISLSDFEATMASLQQKQQPMTVVTYCTIGYRSGLEARRLRDKYYLVEGQVYSLDGILAYTHGPSSSSSSSATTLIRIDTTNTTLNNNQIPTNQVHTFGRVWKNCANPEYETTLYGFPSIVGRLMQVGGLGVLRKTQHFSHLLLESSFCCCRRQQDEKVH
jgi:rhodanese-related sulfurtransferase